MSDKTKSMVQRMAGSNLSPFWMTMSRNWLLKLLCLGLAFVVWQGVNQSNSHEEIVRDVPLSITVGDKFAVLDQSIDRVDIKFSGSQEATRFIGRDRVSLDLAITDQSSLRQTLTLSAKNVTAPDGLRAVSFDPAEVTVTIDREVDRVLPVKASVEGSWPEGIQLEQFVCEPATVRVRGAESQLAKLELVRTAPISVEGRYESFTTHVNIASEGQAWYASPDRVAVQFIVNEHIDTSRFEGCLVRPMLSSGDNRVVTVEPEQVAVILKGTPPQLEGVSLQDIYTYIDCSELTEPTEYDVPVRVHLPEGVQLDQIDPSTVKATVQTL